MDYIDIETRTRFNGHDLMIELESLQVDYIDIETRTRLSVPGHPKDRTYVFGVIWSFAYKLVGSDEEVIMAVITV